MNEAPEVIRRPLCLVHEHAYATTWLWLEEYETTDEVGKRIMHNPPLRCKEPVSIIIRDDGQIFSDAAIKGSKPKSELGIEVHLRAAPHDHKIWNGAGINRFRAGERPDPADVFMRMSEVINHFMDFNHSLAPQRTMV